MAEKWIEKLFEVKSVSDRIILVEIIFSQQVLCFLSVYVSVCLSKRQVLSIDDSHFDFCHRKRHYRCNLCGPTAVGEISSSEQAYLYGLNGPREGI